MKTKEEDETNQENIRTFERLQKRQPEHKRQSFAETTFRTQTESGSLSCSLWQLVWRTLGRAATKGMTKA